MDSAIVIPLLIVLILVVSIAIGVIRQRDIETNTRGSEPGDGYHEMSSHYSSGLGGQEVTWKVPRDPEEYARHFVPKGQKTNLKQ